MGLWQQTNRRELLASAAEAFEHAAEANPEMLVNVAVLRRQLGQRGQALALLDEAIRQRPESTVAIVNRIIFTNDDPSVALTALDLEHTHPTDFHVLAAIAEH